MSLGRAVPWASWAEWRQVGFWLLSEEPEDVQRGLERVAAWRCRGRVPHGVDSTACFVEAQQRDRAAWRIAATPASTSAMSESELRLQYGLAVVRMVNGIADSAQRGRVASSVASLASAAGLPRILVDLRHEATHNELPSLAALRLASQHALAWLQAHYWQRQTDHVRVSLERIQAVVQEYLLLHQAAAAKVAASATAADSDEESAEEEAAAGLSSVAAAMAAAASLSEGRRAGRRGAAAHPAGAASQPGGAATAAKSSGAAAGAYQAAEAKKKRRQLLAELRSAVPRPAAALLADAVLAATSAMVADDTAQAAGEDADKPSSQQRVGGSNPGEAVVKERALAAAMGHLVAAWPQLPLLLLLAAVECLAAAAAPTSSSAAGTHTAQAASPAAALAWLQRLVPGQAPGSRAQHAAATNAGLPAACGDWHPAPALLHRLLAVALPAQAEARYRAACRALQPRNHATGATQAVSEDSLAALRALEEAVSALLAAAKAAPGLPAELDALARLAAIEPAAPDGEQHPARQCADELLSQLKAAASKQQTLLQHFDNLQQASHASCAKRSLPTCPAGSGAVAGAKRWRRVPDWQACALGMLPSVADPNGQLPAREPLRPAGLPPACLQQQGTQLATAEARAMRAAGMEGQQAPQAASMPVMLPIAGDQQGADHWPVLDRFAMTVLNGTEQQALDTSERQQTLPAIDLPSTCSLLI